MQSRQGALETGELADSEDITDRSSPPCDAQISPDDFTGSEANESFRHVERLMVSNLNTSSAYISEKWSIHELQISETSPGKPPPTGAEAVL